MPVTPDEKNTIGWLVKHTKELEILKKKLAGNSMSPEKRKEREERAKCLERLIFEARKARIEATMQLYGTLIHPPKAGTG
jgi:hypothetical protein